MRNIADDEGSKTYKLWDWMYQRIITAKMSYKQIEEVYDIPRETVKEWSKKLGISSTRTKSPSLIISHPELSEEWNYVKNEITGLTPKSVTKGSNQYVWWVCEKGHEWKAQINPRARRGDGCPYCSGRLASPEYNFTNEFPELLKYWDYEKNERPPNDYTRGSAEKVWWTCEIGHSYQSTVANKIKCRGCSYCTGKLVDRDMSLGALYSTISSQWNHEKNIKTPFDYLPHSQELVWWKCEKGEDHEWKVSIGSRHKNGCPFCAGLYASKSYNLETYSPEVAREWDYSKNSKKPREITPKTNDLYWWKCENNHEWLEAPSSRNKIGRDNSCPFCTKRRLSEDYNLEAIYPEIAKEWDYEKNDTIPSQHMPITNTKIWWECSENHSWKTGISNRTSSGNGCPYCSGSRLTEDNSLQTIFPEIALEWHPTLNEKTPMDYHSKSGYKAWWICKNGHDFQCLISDRANGIGCIYCAKKAASKEYNLETVNPELLSCWDYDKNTKMPNQYTPKSNQKVWWLCEFGHSYKTTIKSKANGSSCPNCISNRFTSYPEQFFLYYLSQLFWTSSRIKLDCWEADILLDDHNIVIEYDGWYWHKDKIETDTLKTKELKEMGYEVIRLREGVLGNIEEAINIVSPDKYEDLYSPLRELLNVLVNLGVITTEEINSNLVVDKIEDKARISLKLLDVDKESSIETNNKQTSLLWDFEKNIGVTPMMVGIDSNLNYFWKCNIDTEHTWVETPKNMIAKRGILCPICAKGENNI